MIVRKFARPYARAILDVTGSPEKANEVRKELTSFEAARSGANDLRDLYANPGLDVDTKISITNQVAKRLGLSEMAVKVLEVLIRNHRINDLGAIVSALTFYINEALDVVVAEVRSAHQLSESEVADLKKGLEKKVGKRVEVQLTTDESLIGGFVAQIGSEIYDASVVGKINKFRSTLT
jgi:F-type H+-transporting ATPase subunit delta